MPPACSSRISRSGVPIGSSQMPGPLHAAARAVQLRAAFVGEARLLEPLDALADDVRHVADRFDVVDHRRLAPEAGDRGKRRLRARVAALAFERVQERGLFAADVAAGADVQVQLEADSRSRRCCGRDSAPRRPPRSRARSARPPACTPIAGRCSATSASIAYALRITPSTSWCGSPSISRRSLNVPGSISSALHDEVLRMGRVRPHRHEAPLLTGGEAGAAAAAQARSLTRACTSCGRQVAAARRAPPRSRRAARTRGYRAAPDPV